uniref:Uncharacterized protein n=1 Tax=Setaria italica TaxID=4555 RepID=A0A0Q3RJA2_SETIT
ETLANFEFGVASSVQTAARGAMRPSAVGCGGLAVLKSKAIQLLQPVQIGRL